MIVIVGAAEERAAEAVAEHIEAHGEQQGGEAGDRYANLRKARVSSRNGKRAAAYNHAEGQCRLRRRRLASVHAQLAAIAIPVRGAHAHRRDARTRHTHAPVLTAADAQRCACDVTKTAKIMTAWHAPSPQSAPL